MRRAVLLSTPWRLSAVDVTGSSDFAPAVHDCP
ncbi:MAG: hypothetical protein RIQ60_2868 [Pseudomonadota bacterium]|jgi:hypothetical protein